MSGGSYNHLCWKDAGELFGGAAQSDLQQMADRLAGLGYAPDAAAETMDLLLDLRAFQNRLNARINRLQEVWKAVEWWDSGDYGEDSLKSALAAYRGEGK